MVVGDVKKIDLSTSSFERVITEGRLYVDKTRMIEHFLSDENSQVQLVARQRRLGKSLNMDMLRCFLTDKEDFRHLFKGLYIETSPLSSKAHAAPVFYFDFKLLQADNYKQEIYYKVCDYIDIYCNDVSLARAARNYATNNDFNNANGLLYLTESVYKATGKRSYLLIDEYDKLLMDNYNKDVYDEIREYLTAFFSSGLKGNLYLERALLTGVMRISHESMFSGLNNIVTFDVFNDKVFTDDYGFTEDEISELSRLAGFDVDTVRQWYNGVRVRGKAIYNVYSVMSYIRHKEFECYWGKSGTMHMITSLLNDDRRATIAKLLNGEQAEAAIENRISLRDLYENTTDQAFYSLLVQAGYLALCGYAEGKSFTALVSVPNTELMIVWREFIFKSMYGTIPKVRTLFDNADNMELLANDIEYFIGDRLSYHDLAQHEGAKIYERLYHIFLLGILSAYEDVRCRYPLSNRESGNGRYDILVERPTANFIFEFKTSESIEGLGAKAQEALAQIEAKRYGADLDKGKRLVKIGVALYGKTCKVKCGEG